MSFPAGSGNIVIRESGGGGTGEIGAPGGDNGTGENPPVEVCVVLDNFDRTQAQGAVAWTPSSSGTTWTRQTPGGDWSINGTAGVNHTSGVQRATTANMPISIQVLTTANVMTFRGRFRYLTLPSGNGGGRTGFAQPRFEFSGSSPALLRAFWIASFVEPLSPNNSINPQWSVGRVNNTTTTHASVVNMSWSANQWYYFALKINRTLGTISGGLDTVPVTAFPAVISGQTVPTGFVRLDIWPTYTAGPVNSPPVSEYDDFTFCGSET